MKFTEAENIKYSYGTTSKENAEAFAPYLEYWLSTALADTYTLENVTVNEENKLLATVQGHPEEGLTPSPVVMEYYPITGSIAEDGSVSRNAFSSFDQLLKDNHVGMTEEEAEEEINTDYSFEGFLEAGDAVGLFTYGDDKTEALTNMPLEPNYTQMTKADLDDFKQAMRDYLEAESPSSGLTEEEQANRQEMLNAIGIYYGNNTYFRVGNFVQFDNGTWGILAQESKRSADHLREALSDADKTALQSNIAEIDNLTGGVALEDWFKQETDIPEDQRKNLADIEAPEETSNQSNEKEQASSNSMEVNKLSQEEMSQTFNKLNTYLKNNVAYFKEFLGEAGNNYSMNIFATKMVPKNYKESAIRAYKRLKEGEEFADAMEILVEIQLLKNQEAKQTESLMKSLLNILHEAEGDFADAMDAGTDYSFETFLKNLEASKDDLSRMPTTPVYATMDEKALEDFNAGATDGETAVIDDHVFTVTFADGSTLSQDADGKWILPEPEYQIDENAPNQLLGMDVKEVLSPMQESIVQGLNSQGGVAFKLNGKVTTVNFMIGSNIGAKNQYSGYFTLIAVKTNSRNSVLTQVGNGLKGVAKELYNSAHVLNQKGQK